MNNFNFKRGDDAYDSMNIGANRKMNEQEMASYIIKNIKHRCYIASTSLHNTIVFLYGVVDDDDNYPACAYWNYAMGTLVIDVNTDWGNHVYKGNHTKVRYNDQTLYNVGEVVKIINSEMDMREWEIIV